MARVWKETWEVMRESLPSSIFIIDKAWILTHIVFQTGESPNYQINIP